MVSPWKALKPGRFGADVQRAGIDPLLVWADATGFRDLRRSDDELPTLIPVLCELESTEGLEALSTELKRLRGGRVAGAYSSAPGNATRFCTACFTPDYCAQWAKGRAGRMLKRFELQMPVIPLRASGLKTPSARGRVGTVPRPKADGTLIGIIDSGCPFAHRSVLGRDGRTRLLSIWDQDGAPAYATEGGSVPPDFGYGAEIHRDALNRLIAECSNGGAVDEDACYRRAGAVALNGRVSHGGAVLDLLAGRRALGSRLALETDCPPGWHDANDKASRADIVFVDLPRDSVQDSSSGGLGRWLLDGLRYICSCAGPGTRRIVVNISNGTSRSTHDGSSIIEQAMAALVEEQAGLGRTLHIVIAAGNDRDEERHAQIDQLRAGQPRDLLLRVPPGGESPNWVTLRMPRGARGLTIRLCPPRADPAAASPAVAAGEAVALQAGPGNGVVAGVVFPKNDDALADMALLVVAPTEGNGQPQAPHGDWTLTIDSRVDLAEPVHLSISRNQRNPGALHRGQQARFVSGFEAYDSLRWRREAELDPPGGASPIRRACTLNGLATLPPGQGVVVVGSVYLRPVLPTPYSSAGPSAGPVDGASRQGPDTAAVTDLYRGLRGIVVAGNRSGAAGRMLGTSLAAPQAARYIVNHGVPPYAGVNPDPALTGCGGALV